MKYLLILALLFSVNAHAEKKHIDLARELLVVMDMDSQLKTMAENVRGMQKRQLSQLDLPGKAKPIMEKYLNDTMALIFDTFKDPDVKEKYAELYASNFSKEELKGILDFYSTGAGQAFLEKFPQVMAGITKVAETQLVSVQPKLLEMQQEMQRELEKLK